MPCQDSLLLSADPPGSGPCVKQTVRATLVLRNGRRMAGTNCCRTPQAICPRAHLPTGHGYEMCRDICHQVGHAEVVVLQAAGELARGAKLFVEGHTYVCEPCLRAAQRAKVADVLIGPPPAISEEATSSPAIAWTAQEIAELEAALARVLGT